MANTHGFENLPQINKSIHELYRAFGPKHLQSFTANFALGALAAHVHRDPVIGTQHVAKAIAEIYRLPVTTVVVTYSRTLEPPGRVELSNSNEFFVELRYRLRNEPKSVAAVLAHEVAHIFLHRCGVRFANDFENEVLTDTMATYIGFGPTILNAATQYGVYFPTGDYRHTRTEHFGYLTLDEFGYVQAKRDQTFSMDATSAINAGLPMIGFANGRERFRRERKSHPYTISLTQSFARYLKHLVPNSEKTVRNNPQMFQFACICCSQKLRLPTLGKKLLARCPVCDSKHICFT